MRFSGMNWGVFPVLDPGAPDKCEGWWNAARWAKAPLTQGDAPGTVGSESRLQLDTDWEFEGMIL